jgi:hypothetical protein
VSVVKLILLYFDLLHSVHYNSVSTLILRNPEQQAAPITAFGAQLRVTLIYYIEEFSAVLLRAENIKQMFFYNCVFPDDGPVGLETCSSWCVVTLS